MAALVGHSTAVRNAIATTVLAQIDAEDGSAILEFQTAGSAEVATLYFTYNAAGSIIDEIITFDTILSDTTATGGVITKFEIQDALGVLCLTGTAGISGENINLSSVNIAPGDTVAVSSLTYTAPV